MDTVPKIISTKDLSYLSDIFEWNFTAYKELKHFEKEVENEKVKELMNGLSEMHYQHLELVLSILKGEDEMEDEVEEEVEEEDQENESE